MGLFKRKEKDTTAENSTVEKEETKTTKIKKKETTGNLFSSTSVFFRGDEADTATPKPTLETKHLPADLERYNPESYQGLSNDEVETRKTQGYVNRSDANNTKSIGKILRDNIITYFNMILLAIAAVLIGFGQYTQVTFLVIAIINTAIGIYQEIKARNTLSKLKLVTTSNVEVMRDGKKSVISTNELVLDDVYLLKNGDQIPTDSIILEGKIEVNESLLTGESKAIKKTIGDKIYAGSFIVSGSATVKADLVGEYNYVSGIQAKAKELNKPKSELVRSLNTIIKVIGIAIIPLGALMFWTQWMVNWNATGVNDGLMATAITTIKATAASMIGMIPSGMYLLTSVALASSVVSLSKKNAMVQDLYSVEMLARVNTLCLDKTGTLTDGTMRIDEVLIVNSSYDMYKLVGSYLNAFPESNQTSVALTQRYPLRKDYIVINKIPFSSARKFSAVQFNELGTFLLGAPEYLYKTKDKTINNYIAEKQAAGYRVVMICKNENPIVDGEVKGKNTPIALFTLEDHIRNEAPDTIKWFVENGVDVKIISGDNPLTAAEIAQKCGVPNAEKCVSLEGLSDNQVRDIVDDYAVFGRVSPEQKACIIKTLKQKGKTVGMTGDGVNDILAMKNADCSVAMANGSSAARNAANLVLLDSNFASMPAAVQEGRRVINNVQRSSSLYLMKTIFTAVFTIIVLITFPGLRVPYPFEPNNLLITEMVCIGWVSIFLALQKNSDLISGSFMKNTFAKAIPAGICLILAISLNYIWYYLPGNFLEFDPALTASITEINKIGTARALSAPGITFNSLTMAVVALGMAFSLVIPMTPLSDPKNRFRFIMFSLTILFFCIMVFIFPFLPAMSGSFSSLSEQFIGIDFRTMTKPMWFMLIIYLFGFYALLNILTKAFSFMTKKAPKQEVIQPKDEVVETPIEVDEGKSE